MARIGIFGGTFDPPHVGHLILAAEARDQLHLDRVLWMVTPNPPHKRGRVITPLDVRLALVQAAVCEDPHFEVSTVEADRPGPHYSVDTVRILACQNPGADLFYLMGGDSLHDLPTWMKPRELVAALAGLGVMRRPQDSVDLPGLERALPGIGAKIFFVNTPLLEISSSDIRERVAQGQHYRYFVPQTVFDLVEAGRLYRR